MEKLRSLIPQLIFFVCFYLDISLINLFWYKL